MNVMQLVLLGLLILAGPAIAGSQGDSQSGRNKKNDEPTNNLTVGKVQREIHVGMPSAAVAEILGSPNVVSTDEERREVWIYDKISTDVSYKSSSVGAGIIIVGGGKSTGSSSTRQKTLTIIIKFDKQGKVRDFAYNNSQF